MHMQSTAAEAIVTIDFVVVTIENNISCMCFLLEGRSVGTGHPLTVECHQVLSHVPSQSVEKPTDLEVHHEGTAFNT